MWSKVTHRFCYFNMFDQHADGTFFFIYLEPPVFGERLVWPWHWVWIWWRKSRTFQSTWSPVQPQRSWICSKKYSRFLQMCTMLFDASSWYDNCPTWGPRFPTKVARFSCCALLSLLLFSTMWL